MNKIINYVKENYKLMIPIALLMVVFIAFLIYYKVIIADNYHIDKDEEVYQYFYSQKYEYVATISKNRKDVIVDYKPKDIKVNLDSTPIYYKNSEVVILPSNMSVVMPTLNCQEYLSNKYSYVTHNKNTYSLTTNKYNNRLNHYFFFDGNNLYFFIEPVTLKVGKEEIKLSSLSYVVANGNNITYYDKLKDESKSITNGSLDDYIENDYYKVFINRDSIDYQGSNVILTQDISKLNTIDMKG